MLKWCSFGFLKDYWRIVVLLNTEFISLGFFWLLQVGKGLSKDEKAQKLALQHWLEAVWVKYILFKHYPVITLHRSNWNSLMFHGQIDPRHRYGHNLHYYYQHWLHCESKQPFFYWYSSWKTLKIVCEPDEQEKFMISEITFVKVGCGWRKGGQSWGPLPKMEVAAAMHQVSWPSKLLHPANPSIWNLKVEKVTSLNRRWYCYFVQKERESFEVIIEDRKLMYKLSRKIVDTSEGPKDSKWIFVLSTTRVLYIGVVRE